MSTDLELRAVVVPYSGEVVSLDATDRDLGRLLDEVKEVESKLRELKGEVSRELVGRMDRARKWTIDAGGFKLAARSDAPEETFDVDALAFALTNLVEDGTITSEAMDSACELVSSWKPKKAGINALRKNPALAVLIDACGTETPPEGRRVQVSRK